VRAIFQAAPCWNRCRARRFRDEVESAFEKLSSALTPHMRQFPRSAAARVIATKADPMRRH